VPEEVRRQFYDAIGKAPGSTFPIEIAADPAVSTGVARALVTGFYKGTGDKTEVER
jgi:hypothetical protein